MSRYAAAHVDPQGPGDARPTALQIVQDEDMVGKLVGKVVVITGVSSGIGIETVRALAATGATLYVTARDLTKATAALVDIWNPERMELVDMDLASFQSVRLAAEKILSKTDKVSILVNNAGVMAVPELQLTEDGHELQFGTNHLAHFLFFQLLKPALLAATTPQFQSRVVSVASSGHRLNGINASDNYNFEKGEYHPWVAYGQSKTANVYFANEIERRYGARGLHATSVHPGAVGTELSRHIAAAELEALRSIPGIGKSFKSLEQGAATSVWAAIGKEWEGKGGKYLSDCSVAKKGEDDRNLVGADYVSHTYDAESAARLWEDSLKLCRIPESD